MNNYNDYNDYNEYSSEDYSSDELPESDELEEAYFQTISEFSDFVAAITTDLEKAEMGKIEKARVNGEDYGIKLWEDSTFKVTFTKKLIFMLFKPERLIKYHLCLLHPLKPWLEARDVNFFLKNEHIYPGAPEEDIKFFKDLWQVEGTMTKKEKDTIWTYFDTLIEIAEDWQKATGWVRGDNDDLDVPEIDYNKAHRHAQGESVSFGERVIYMPEDGTTSYIANKKSTSNIKKK